MCRGLSPGNPGLASLRSALTWHRFAGRPRPAQVTRARSRERFPPRGLATQLRCRPRRAARDAGVMTDPTASAPRGDEAMPRIFRRLRRSPGAPRAVFEACSARTPVDLPSPVFSEAHALSTAGGPPRLRRSAFGTREGQPQRGPCDARSARRAGAAWAAGGRLAKGIGRPPLPVRTSVRVATRPFFGPRRRRSYARLGECGYIFLGIF